MSLNSSGVQLIRDAFPLDFKLDRRIRSAGNGAVSIHLLNENPFPTPSCSLSGHLQELPAPSSLAATPSSSKTQALPLGPTETPLQTNPSTKSQVPPAGICEGKKTVYLTIFLIVLLTSAQLTFFFL